MICSVFIGAAEEDEAYILPGEAEALSVAIPVKDLDGDSGSDLLVIEIISDQITGSPSTEISAVRGVDGGLLWHRAYPDSLALATQAGDLDGDGLTDVLVDILIADTQSIPSSGVQALDGRSGVEIWGGRHTLAATLSYPIGDLTGDGISEVLVHVMGFDSLNGTLATKISQVSGSDGTEIEARIFPGALAVEYPTGNLTEDGAEEMMVAAFRINQPPFSTDLEALDGLDRHALWRRSLPGIAIASSVQDLTGDGLEDLAASIWNISENGTSTEIAAIRGEDGDLLWQMSLGPSLAFAVQGPDLTGDGSMDLIVYSIQESGDYEVAAVAGEDGRELWSMSGVLLLPEGLW
ncbi:MAG: hypothetical protein QUS08_08060 [Methanothrix sp.]|nr:hypothetical protein [Methanothrix sp.]